MEKETVQKTLQELRENSQERKFTQSVDVIVTLKELNLKNPDEQVEFFLNEPHQVRKQKVCAIVGGELQEDAKENCDKTITQAELDAYKKDKKAAKKLASQYDWFVAQANLMGKVAGAFGRVFGPRGKMPNPKAGCVVSPKGSLKPLYERLQTTVKVSAKKAPFIQLTAGDEKMKDEDIAENIAYFYDQIEKHLPRERHNIKNVYVKFTMGKPVKLL